MEKLGRVVGRTAGAKGSGDRALRSELAQLHFLHCAEPPWRPVNLRVHLTGRGYLVAEFYSLTCNGKNAFGLKDYLL